MNLNLKSISLYLIIAASALIIYVSSYLNFMIPYTDHDSVIYAYIGKGILSGHLPYTFAFDHKPIFIYYFYSFFELIYQFNRGLFVFVSLSCLLITSLLTCKISEIHYKYALPICAFLLISSYKYIELTGNSEFIFVMFSIASLFLLINKNSHRSLFFSSILAVMAFQTNYLSCIGLAPAIIYLLLSTKTDRVKNIALYSLYFLLFNIALFIPLIAFNGLDALVNYFALQIAFLKSYGGSPSGSFEYFFTIFIIFSGVIMCSIIMLIRSKDYRIVPIVILSIFSFFGSILSGMPYGHYAYPFIVSSCILAIINTKHDKILSLCSTLVPFLYFGYATANSLNNRYLHEDYKGLNTTLVDESKQIKSIVGVNKVLAVKSTHIPFYFGDLIPSQPLVWASHSAIIYGGKEVDYFNDEISKKPKYVLVASYICNKSWVKTNFCENLNLNYVKVKSFDKKLNVSLYKLK